ncbi:MAG: hypothetical protein AAGI34_16860 [Pseudomonadota bacterium]
MTRLPRRTVLGLLLATPAAAHTPYQQWVVYRRKHLLLGCHRGDAAGYALAKRAAEELAAHLPKSRARVARAPGPARIASLLATDQLDLAVLDTETAQAMAAGDGTFAAYGKQQLATLALFDGDRALLAHPRFPERHASLVAETLIGSGLAPREVQHTPPLPWHKEALVLLGE